MMEKLHILEKKFSPQKVLKITYNAVFTILQTNFFPEGRKCFAHCQKMIEKKDNSETFRRFFFRTLQVSSAHVDCVFTASSITFCQKVVQKWKWWKNEPSSAEYFYFKCSYDHVKRSFDNLAKKNCRGGRKIFSQVTKIKKESESFVQYVLPSFPKPQVFISTCRMQVLPPRPKIFASWPKFCRSMFQNDEENVEGRSPTKIVFIQKIFAWLRTIQFWHPWRESFAQRMQTFT